MKQTGLSSVQGYLHSTGHVSRRNPMKSSLVQIDLNVVLGLGIFYVPVNIDNTWRVLEDLLDLACQRKAPTIVRAIDFGHQCLQHRRARRNFADLDAGAELLGDLLQSRTDAAGDFVALGAAIVA